MLLRERPAAATLPAPYDLRGSFPRRQQQHPSTRRRSGRVDATGAGFAIAIATEAPLRRRTPVVLSRAMPPCSCGRRDKPFPIVPC